eukprot:COSAG02_NODE_2262_length_9317_cov_21.181927_10_plen_64_part_00
MITDHAGASTSRSLEYANRTLHVVSAYRPVLLASSDSVSPLRDPPTCAKPSTGCLKKKGNDVI